MDTTEDFNLGKTLAISVAQGIGTTAAAAVILLALGYAHAKNQERKAKKAANV